MSYRLFAAIRPPEDIVARLLSARGRIDGARWQEAEQLHLTLAFFGGLEGDQAEALAEALYHVDQPAFDAALGPFGSFPAPGHRATATLWIGVEPKEPLARLAASIRGAARQAGIVLPRRRFVPHITLARFGGAGAAAEDFAPYLAGMAAPAGRWRVTRFHLIESFLRREGALYVPRVGYRLKESFADRRQP